MAAQPSSEIEALRAALNAAERRVEAAESHANAAEAQRAHWEGLARVLQQRLDGFVHNIPGIAWESYFRQSPGTHQSPVREQSPATMDVDYVSDLIEPISGYTADEWKQPNFWLELVHPGDKAQALADSHRVFREGHGSSSYRWLTKGGRTLWVTSRMTLIVDKAGVPIGLRGVTMDETGIKQAEAQRLLDAQEAIRARDEFLSIASHELRTPLTAALLNVHLLERSLKQLSVPPRVGEIVAKVERQQIRIANLLDGLLDVARIRVGRLELAREYDVDLAEVVRDVVDRLQPDFAHPGCAVDLASAGLVRGHWDRLRLEQVVMNLLSNALKYGNRAPIEIAVTSDGVTAKLVVRDHGIGIPRTSQARVFERFERAASSRHYGGLGLGLYIVRQIVEAHGGTISLDSEPNVGSTFTVELPVRQ
ncbi:PAS domain-containing sensor histidine kinase [Nannocystis radixulma]|uniref:histidine kinase n=1 Tax=Nannocystis radixulma TaxID=2995305 RepID=A0ABT5B4N2_9BACT|nr:HAMP domain-containing sensor histidine kinase [Nannocystis radixulma]MDC0669062.1 HAMP domain-containing sensor histidine kinase [Nannocystis radixulma]